MKPKIEMFSLIVAVFCAGLSASLFLIPYWIGPFLSAAASKNPADWIGFAGSFAAGIMTIVAAVVAWFAVQAQIRAQAEVTKTAEEVRQYELEAHQIAAKFTATIAVTQPVHSAAAVLFSVRKAMTATLQKDIDDWDAATKQACGQLEKTLDHFSLKQAGPEMNVNDRALFLILVVQLSSIVNIFNRPTGILSRQENLALMKNQLEGLRQYLTTYDIDLANVFERDPTV